MESPAPFPVSEPDDMAKPFLDDIEEEDDEDEEEDEDDDDDETVEYDENFDD